MLARVTANQLAPGRPSDRFDEEASVPKRHSLLGSAGQQAAFLSKPLSTTRCVLGWVVATGLFLGCVSLWYTSSVSDNLESLVPAAAFEQGSLHCAYPSQITSSVPPLFPLIAAGVMEVTRIGASEASAYLYTGVHCVTPDNAFYRSFSAKQSLYVLGFIGWPVLLAGFVALLRAAGRGRSRYEFLGVCLLACTPAVTEPLVEFFHPEDLVAMGLILLGLAATIHRRWVAAGLCIGLACCTKQYALLALAPLLVAAPLARALAFPGGRRGRGRRRAGPGRAPGRPGGVRRHRRHPRHAGRDGHPGRTAPSPRAGPRRRLPARCRSRWRGRSPAGPGRASGPPSCGPNPWWRSWPPRWRCAWSSR